MIPSAWKFYHWPNLIPIVTHPKIFRIMVFLLYILLKFLLIYHGMVFAPWDLIFDIALEYWISQPPYSRELFWSYCKLKIVSYDIFHGILIFYVILSIYVCSGSVVPAIWFLELHEYDERLQKHICQDTRSWMQLTLLQTNPGCQLSKFLGF